VNRHQGGKRVRGGAAGVAAEGAEVKSSSGAASSTPKGQSSVKRRRKVAGGPAKDMREGLECDGVGGLFAALPPDACGIIISYLAQLDLVRIQYVCKGWFALVNASAVVRSRLRNLNLSWQRVIVKSRTRSGRTLRNRREKKSIFFHLASEILRSAGKMGMLEVSLGFVVFKAWPGLPDYLQDGALQRAMDQGYEELFRRLCKASSYILGIYFRKSTLRPLRTLLLKCPVIKSLTFDRTDTSPNLSWADMEGFFIAGASYCGTLTDLTFIFQQRIDVYCLFLILRACPNLSSLTLVGEERVEGVVMGLPFPSELSAQGLEAWKSRVTDLLAAEDGVDDGMTTLFGRVKFTFVHESFYPSLKI
jgi:hypothetical protein